MICQDVPLLQMLNLSPSSVNFIQPDRIREWLDRMLSDSKTEYKLICYRGSITFDTESTETSEPMFSEEQMQHIVSEYDELIDRCKDVIAWGIAIVDFRLACQNRQYYTVLSYVVPSGKKHEIRYIRDYPTTDIFPTDLLNDLRYLKQKHPAEVFQDKPEMSAHQSVAQLRTVLEDLAANKDYGYCKFDILSDGTFTVTVTLPSGLVMTFSKEAKDIYELNKHIVFITSVIEKCAE